MEFARKKAWDLHKKKTMSNELISRQVKTFFEQNNSVRQLSHLGQILTFKIENLSSPP